MSEHDEVPAILEPYDPQFKVWDGGGRAFKQHDLVPAVGMATTYAVMLDAPRGTPVRFLTVQENRITNVMAHQPIPGHSVFDKWGKYLGRGGGALEEPGSNPIEEAVSLIEQATQGAPPAVSPAVEAEGLEPQRTFLEPPSPDEKVECHQHRFWLRDDLEVKVKLPLDLTDEEAERFAVFVTTLPLSAKKFE